MTEHPVSLAAIFRECDELFMCPTIEMQLAACVWAERAHAELERLKAADRRFPWEVAPLAQHAVTDAERKRQMRALIDRDADTRANARAVKACEEMQAQRDAEGARIRAQQAWNEEEWTTSVAEDDPRLRMDVTCAEAIVNGHSTYLLQIPQQQREVVVPALGRSKRSAVSEYSTAGQHQKVGWNFYTDLFECHECDQGAQLKMDLMKLPCTRKKGRR